MSLVDDVFWIVRRHFADPGYFAEQYNTSVRIARRQERQTRQRLEQNKLDTKIDAVLQRPAVAASFLVFGLLICWLTWDVKVQDPIIDGIIAVSGLSLALNGFVYTASFFLNRLQISYAKINIITCTALCSVIIFSIGRGHDHLVLSMLPTLSGIYVVQQVINHVRTR